MRLLCRLVVVVCCWLVALGPGITAAAACPLPCVYVEVEEPPGWVLVCPPVL